MPITYTCEHCGTTADNMGKWKMISVVYLHHDPNAQFPPGGRSVEAIVPDVVFHSEECRDAWATAHNLTIPTEELARSPFAPIPDTPA